MKNIKIVIISLFVALGGCTGSNQGNNSNNDNSEVVGAAPQGSAIENSMTVMGDRAVIESTLSSMKVDYKISTFNKNLNIHAVDYYGDVTYAQISRKLASKVELMEQNQVVQLDAIEKKIEWMDDPYFFYQWGSNNIGQSAPWGLPGKYDADVKLLQTLQKFKGQLSEKVVVAVIDSGVDHSHEDLNANMWVNTKESKKDGGIAGEDDDGNGYTDDVHGYDFTKEGRMAPHYGQIGDEDPNDENGHGSHCAGVIAAVQDNQIGIAGANPMAQIMALRAFTSFGDTQAIQRAITYATENGANIISASFGGTGKSEITKALIEEAGKQGILWVASSGNEGENMELEANRRYPATYDVDNMITVGASDNMDNPASFSNYGANHVDVYAPGVGILSLYKDGGYTIMGGTSMATPLVAGIASLLMSAYPDLKKDPVRVKEIIMATVDKKASMYGKVGSNGRVNALKAMEQGQAAVSQSPLVWQEEAQNIQQIGHNTELVDIQYKIEKPNAKALRVHFDFMEVDTRFDSIYIYDKTFKLITQIQNGSSRDLWSPVVSGDVAYVRFVNAKVKKQGGGAGVPMAMTELNSCLKKGGRNLGPVVGGDPLKPVDQFLCLEENISYKYEDLKKDVEDKDVFFSWQSKGFSIDKIEFTESAI